MGTVWKIQKRTSHSLVVIKLVLIVNLMFFSLVSCEYCNAEIGEEDMKMMESETGTQRILLGGKLISPGVLRHDVPFCKSVGRPYAASCLPSPANPYGRGCTSVYRCRHRWLSFFFFFLLSFFVSFFFFSNASYKDEAQTKVFLLYLDLFCYFFFFNANCNVCTFFL